MNTFEIALKTKQLPDKIEELVPMMFAGQAAVRFMSAKLKAVSDKNVPDPLGLLEEQRKKTVEDGQAMGEMLLRVMGRIGELSTATPQEWRGRNTSREKITGKIKYKKLGMNSKRQLEQAQFINNHPELVEETIEECKNNDDIPNITTVLNKHKHKRELEKEKERHKKAEIEGRSEKTRLQMTLEQAQYIHSLEMFTMSVPKEPPRNWEKEAFDKACELWDIIFEYGKTFKNINNKMLGE
jgi:hypothetical protein